MSGALKGYEALKGKLHEAPGRALRKMEDAVDYIVRELANYAKDTGNYTDQTGNLRNSIHGVVVKITRDYIHSEVRASMEYAGAVEARGYKVISHILVERWDWILKTLGDYLDEFIAEENR